jgi:Ca-activated chloride channel family protein
MLYDWLKHTTFAYPFLLPLLLVVTYMIVWYVKNHRKQTASFKVTTTHFLQHTISWKARLRHIPFVLRCLGLIALIIALARPQHTFTEEQTNGEGIDIVLCFDISGSMTEQDFVPNRIEASKEVAAKFVNSRPGDRIGITIFSSQSFTMCPITTDHNTVLTQINNIQSGYLQDEGTAIGSGIATSIDRLKDSKSKSKIIILLTDGVDFGGVIPPDIAMQMAKTYGVKIYTIGVGSDKEMNVQVQTPMGTQTEKKKLEFNEGLLKTMANETGGQYFHATDKEALEKIYVSIDQLEKSKVQMTSYHRHTDEYFWFLVVGLICITIELILRLTLLRKFP